MEREELGAIARRAGELLLQRRAGGGAPRVVSRDEGPTSELDLELDALLVGLIGERRPGEPVLSEHGTRELAAPEGTRAWVVDPLDGTANYLAGGPLFAVSIARGTVDRAGRLAIEAAAVHLPALGELYTAAAGEGSWLGARRLRLDGAARLEESLLGLELGAPPFDPAFMAALLGLASRAQGLRVFGAAAVTLAWTAAGRLGGVCAHGVRPWDLAAGELLVREAGGAATDPAGAGFDGLRGRHLLAGAAPLHARLREHLGR